MRCATQRDSFMSVSNIPALLRRIEKQVKTCVIPIVTEFSFTHKPYLVLISCMLSLRTKDSTTAEASRRLFAVANTPQKILRLARGRLEKLIYPVGFYREKAEHILETSRIIVGRFKGVVPRTIDELLLLKGVGRKTANLVLGLGFGIPAICVDTHVHRISNRLGWIVTQSPEETEIALSRIVPRRLWIDLNTILVTFGQNICVPVSPWCSRCAVARWCKRKGVRVWR
jgi:endonuclease-3